MIRTLGIAANEKLQKKIKTKHLIPYRMHPSIKYKNGHWYYSDYWSQSFKVLEVHYDKYDILKDAYIKWDDGNYGLICTDLDFSDFELMQDKKDLHNLKDIVNSDKLYTGAEIAYWFYIHDIDCFNKKYKGFSKFIDRFSIFRIADSAYYTITGDLIDNERYINCKIVRKK